MNNVAKSRAAKRRAFLSIPMLAGCSSSIHRLGVRHFAQYKRWRNSVSIAWLFVEAVILPIN
jgi:hypothetical protein